MTYVCTYARRNNKRIGKGSVHVSILFKTTSLENYIPTVIKVGLISFVSHETIELSTKEHGLYFEPVKKTIHKRNVTCESTTPVAD